ncbi:hypothetical protein VTN77DRAFT_8667 [Rasamsonia byssochlamydoides]|uniref:uncharacterized protein n=1 Tax=Rasamsonia byssochlamydoides TaxID=89139 RepID=UPI0037421919
MAPITPVSSQFVPDDETLSPTTAREWKVALYGIKQQYLHRKYKQCATRASRLLDTARRPIHPVYKTYLQFYLAISYEMLGRAAHHYASSKLPLLQLALDHLMACNMSLPPLIPVPESSPEPESGSSDEWTSSPSSGDTEDVFIIEDIIGSISRMIELSVESPFLAEDDPFVSLETFGKEVASCSFELPKQSFSPKKLMPSPLRIRKVRQQNTLPPNKEAMKSTGSPVPPRMKTRAQPFSLPLKIVASWNSNDDFIFQSEEEQHRLKGPRGSTSNKGTTNRNDLTFTPRRGKAIRRYNNLIQSFGAQLRSNIATVSALIANVTELQHIHRTTRCPRSKSFWSFRPLEERQKDQGDSCSRLRSGALSVHSFSFAIPGALLDETKQQRISRLRSERWATVGLKNPRRGWKGREYYERFCSQVLDDFDEE